MSTRTFSIAMAINISLDYWSNFIHYCDTTLRPHFLPDQSILNKRTPSWSITFPFLFGKCRITFTITSIGNIVYLTSLRGTQFYQEIKLNAQVVWTFRVPLQLNQKDKKSIEKCPAAVSKKLRSNPILQQSEK